MSEMLLCCLSIYFALFEIQIFGYNKWECKLIPPPKKKVKVDSLQLKYKKAM